MYSYILDTFLSGKKYDKELRAIETRLVDLGIGGRMHKLTKFKNPKDIVAEEIKKGTKTLVLLGNDNTLGSFLDMIVEEGLTMGIIPFGEENKLAKLLGIPLGVEACDTLGSRIIEKLDIGRMNMHYFLSSIVIPRGGVTLIFDGKYKVAAADDREVVISNIEHKRVANPRDGMLEAVIRSRKMFNFFGDVKNAFNRPAGDSRFFVKKAIIAAEKPFPAFADGRKLWQDLAQIEVASKKLKVIVGRDREI